MGSALMHPEQRFGRRPPRMDTIFDRYDPAVWFVTFCAYQRRAVLASPAIHDALIAFARRGHEDRGVAVGRYVLMPDHVHLFVCARREFALGDWVKLLKQHLGKALGHRRDRDGRLWQEGFFDHLLRHDESLTQKWEYVRMNPVRAGLVANADEWQFQGEIVPIDRV